MRLFLLCLVVLLLVHAISSKIITRKFDIKEFLDNKYKFITKYTPTCFL